MYVSVIQKFIILGSIYLCTKTNPVETDVHSFYSQSPFYFPSNKHTCTVRLQDQIITEQFNHRLLIIIDRLLSKLWSIGTIYQAKSGKSDAGAAGRRFQGSERSCRLTQRSAMLNTSRFMEHGRLISSNAPRPDRRANGERGGGWLPCGKLCFGIICGLTEMFLLGCKTAGSTDGHLPLQPNMKANFCAAIFFFHFFFFTCQLCMKSSRNLSVEFSNL